MSRDSLSRVGRRGATAVFASPRTTSHRALNSSTAGAGGYDANDERRRVVTRLLSLRPAEQRTPDAPNRSNREGARRRRVSVRVPRRVVTSARTRPPARGATPATVDL